MNAQADRSGVGRNAVAVAVGKRLKELRIKAGKSQEELAHDASVARARISAIEVGDGNPTVLTIAALCRALGVSLAELFAPLTMQLDDLAPRRVNEPHPPRVVRPRLR